MNPYELLLLLDPELTDERQAEIVARAREIVEKGEGAWLSHEPWGKRKLAYEIKKQLKGIYLYWQFLGTTGMVEEIERNLRMLDSVIRYYTVKVDEDVDPEARPTGVDEDTFTKAASTVPDEEELATGAVLPRFRDDDDGDDFDAGLDDLDLKGEED